MAKKRDWAAYNAALERRGSLTLFVDDAVVEGWMNEESPGRPGAPFTFSAAAYAACYSLQIVYSLPLRQTRGFVNSLLRLLGTELAAPSAASLCEQRQRHPVEPFVAPASGPLTLLLDATGFKTVGAGEWLNHKWHAGQTGPTNRRRWRKLHIGVDHASGQIVSFEVTDSSVGDITAAPALVATATRERGLAEVIADGAYDSKAMYELVCDAHGATATIRLPWTAARGLHPARDESFRVVNWHGQAEWRKRRGYGRRSLVETTMSRLKGLAPRLAARSAAGQVGELHAVINVANRFAFDATAA